MASLLAQTAQLAWVALVALTEPLASPPQEQVQEALRASGAVVLALPQEQVVLAWALVVAKLADHRPDSRALASVQHWQPVAEQSEVNSPAWEGRSRHPPTPDAN